MPMAMVTSCSDDPGTKEAPHRQAPVAETAATEAQIASDVVRNHGRRPTEWATPSKARNSARESAIVVRKIVLAALRASARTPDGSCRAAASTRSFRSGGEVVITGSSPARTALRRQKR